MQRTRFSIAGLMGFVLVVALGIGGLKASDPLWARAYYTLAVITLLAGVLLAIQSRARKRAFWIGFSIVGWTYFAFVFVMPPDMTGLGPPQFLTSSLIEKANEWFFPSANNAVVNVTLAPTPVLPPILPAPPAPAMIVAPPSSPLVVDPFEVIMGTTPATDTATAAVAASALVPLPVPLPPPAIANTTFTTATYSVSSAYPTLNVSPFMLPISPDQLSFQQIGQCMATLIFAYLGGLFSLFLASRRERSEATLPTPEVSPSSP